MKSLELWEHRISFIRATKPYSVFTKVAQTQGLEKEIGTWEKKVKPWRGWKVPEMFTLKRNTKNPSGYHLPLESAVHV